MNTFHRFDRKPWPWQMHECSVSSPPSGDWLRVALLLLLLFFFRIFSLFSFSFVCFPIEQLNRKRLKPITSHAIPDFGCWACSILNTTRQLSSAKLCKVTDLDNTWDVFVPPLSFMQRPTETQLNLQIFWFSFKVTKKWKKKKIKLWRVQRNMWFAFY